MPAGTVWLMLIPCCCLASIWQIFVVINVTQSLGGEFRRRVIPGDDKPGFGIGLTMAILSLVGSIVGIIPIVGPIIALLMYLAVLVLWIIFWIKIAGYSRQLA